MLSKLWLAIEGCVVVLATSERSSLRLELIEADSWKNRRLVVLGSVVVDLVNWNSGVGDVWLDSLALDHWLDCLVDVL